MVKLRGLINLRDSLKRVNTIRAIIKDVVAYSQANSNRLAKKLNVHVPRSRQVNLTSQSLSDVSPEEKRPCESDSLRSMTSDLAHIDLKKI